MRPPEIFVPISADCTREAMQKYFSAILGYFEDPSNPPPSLKGRSHLAYWLNRWYQKGYRYLSCWIDGAQDAIDVLDTFFFSGWMETWSDEQKEKDIDFFLYYVLSRRHWPAPDWSDKDKIRAMTEDERQAWARGWEYVFILLGDYHIIQGSGAAVIRWNAKKDPVRNGLLRWGYYRPAKPGEEDEE